MRFSAALLAASLISTVAAHFQLQYPPPRGEFDEDNEPTLCDGYTSVATNRTEFPLDNGFFTLNSEHAKWTAGVYLSTDSDPTSFDDFNQIEPFFQVNGEGAFCIPLNLASTNATGLKDGSNVTIQIVFSGGDGNLYQCADLTLSSSFKIDSSVSCTNATGTTTTGSATSSATDAASASASTTPNSAVGTQSWQHVGATLGLAAVMFLGSVM